jgi:hypothetical protein
MVRRFVLLVSTLLLAFLASGCGPGKSDIEKSIRSEMKTSLGVDITTVQLNKQSDGSFVGTATAQNGDVYDVTTLPPKGNKCEWKALPGLPMVERRVREGLEQQLKVKVKSIQLTKNGPDSFAGSAELSTGVKMTVKTRMEGLQMLFEAKPVIPE